MTLRVVVADDQALVRAGFCGIIAATPGFAVVGEASNGAEAVDVADRTRPDVVLMDVRMPVMDGIEATRQITGSRPRAEPAACPRVLILTTFDLDEYVYSALRAGASGFMLKSTQPSELMAAIRVVADGDALLAPSVTRRLVEEFVRRPAPAAGGRAAGPGLPGGAVTPGPGSASGPWGAPTVAGQPSSAAGWGGARSGEAAGPLPGTLPGSTLAAITAREREVLKLIATGLSNNEVAEHLSITPATAKTHVAHLLTKLAARDRVHLVILAYQAGLVTVG